MKTLKISYTIYPTGRIKPYPDGMPKPKRKAPNTMRFNTWHLNTIREGGIAYQHLSLSEQAQKIANQK